MSVKLTDVVKSFAGDDRLDVCEWLKKVEMIATFQKIEDLSTFIPMFLEGQAFAVYDQLEETSKKSYDLIKAALISAFSLTPYQGYQQFKSRRLQENESVDGYLADLKRLMVIMGASEEKATLCCQFIDGLPEDVASQVKALQGGKMIIGELLTCAKAVLADRKSTIFGIGAAGAGFARRPERKRDGQHAQGRKCESCGRYNHTAANCRVECYKCHEMGHIARNCPGSGNEQRGTAACAPAVAPQPKEQ